MFSDSKDTSWRPRPAAVAGREVGRILSYEDALRIILDSVRPLDGETICILDAMGRFLAEDIVAATMLPLVDDSAMDGYAIRAEDSSGASPDAPVVLRIIGEIRAGGSASGITLTTGTAVRIMTGAPIPPGADAVIPIEYTDEQAGCVRVFRQSGRHDNYRPAGENIRVGDRLFLQGDRLKSADIGVLASLSYTDVRVYRRPAVSIISTGDELADFGQTIQSGQIRNINVHTLYPEVQKCGGIPRYFGIARDALKDMRGLFRKALEADVIISTGGISKGKYDFVKEICADFGIDILFEWVNIKPGRPCMFGKLGDKLVFGLPGNPVPALISFIQFVRPALLRVMGASRISKPLVHAIADEDIKSAPAHHFVRGCFTVRGNEFHVATTGNQKPSILRSMSAANCLIVIPENVTGVKAGEKVTIQLIYHDEA